MAVTAALLHLVLLAPVAAAVISGFSSAKDPEAAKRLGIFMSLALAVIGTALICAGPLTTDAISWFSLWKTNATVHYQLSSNGVNAWLVQLCTWLTPLAIISGARAAGNRMREYLVGIFILQATMIGALLAADLVVFYLFYEAMLMPALVLVNLFGDKARMAASLRFFLTTMLGSIFMLIGIWWLANNCHSTTLVALPQALANNNLAAARPWLFLAFVLAFAVKVPLIGLHFWQAPLYRSSPAGLGVMVAGAMAKLGGYGFLMIVLPLFPDESRVYAPLMVVLGTVGVIAGALCAWAAKDLRRILAFSSLSHLGLVVAAIFAFAADDGSSSAAASGAVITMVAHGLSIGALFMLVGVLEERGLTSIDNFGGIAQRAPGFALLFIGAVLASAALPGTLAFAGEFMMIYGIATSAGVASSQTLALVSAGLAGLGVILGVLYLLNMTQQVLFGPVPAGETDHDAPRLKKTEAVGIAAAVLASLVLGFVPGLISQPVDAALKPSVSVVIPVSSTTAEMPAGEAVK